MKPYLDAWGRHTPSPMALEVMSAACDAQHPPAYSTGRHHRLKAIALFQRMLATDFTPLAELVKAEALIARQQAVKKLKPHALRERDIERYLVKRVKELGGEVRKVVWPGRRGAPDRLVMLGLGRATKRLAQALMDEHSPALADELLVELLGLVLVWPELKAPGVKPESHQLREHERMRAMGQRVVVIDSIEGVEELLS